ncbi:MAG TPA: NAD-dependent epimerase/dehydratase family protein, partial [Armatimonadota bacterium]|nr:NAD-dependent epimerase/dehydratase family protein [Armatimonadota bacterium]
YGDGLQSRDFTYVANVVEGNLLAASTPGVAGEVFNIACGDQIPLRHVLDSIATLLDRQCTPTFLPARTGDVKHSRADITAAQERLGYQPRVTFAEGLAQTVASYANIAPATQMGMAPAGSLVGQA